MLSEDDKFNLAYGLSIFGTYLGLINWDSNTAQHEHQKELERKIDTILDKLDHIERRLNGETDSLQ